MIRTNQYTVRSDFMFRRVLGLILIVFCVSIVNSSHIYANSVDELLLIGAKNNDMSTIKMAIANGANINYIDQNQEMVLRYAIKNRNLALVTYFVNKGADVNAPSKIYPSRALLTPLAAAVFEHDYNVKMVQFLIDAGADINSTIEGGGGLETDGDTPLILSIACDHIYAQKPPCMPAFKLLISKKADVNKANKYGVTPLMVAADISNYAGYKKESLLEVAKILLANGADPGKVDSLGKTALQYAYKYNFTEMIELLLPVSPK